MQISLRIAIWNADGLSKHTIEVEIFLHQSFIDILLLSAIHFINRSHFKIKRYNLITADHPGDRIYIVSAIVVRSTIKYKTSIISKKLVLQASWVKVNCNISAISISAVYFSPRFFNIKM